MMVSLMRKHGLDTAGWQFGWDYSMVLFGRCHYNSKVITMSRPLVEANSRASAKDTMLHEIAHALAGPRVKHHGRKWKQLCTQIGADPSEYADPTLKRPFKYVVTCELCSVERVYSRRVQGLKCWDCGNPVHWSATQYAYSKEADILVKL